jgi:triphosphoribosyl-dephospho-CoA synthase
MSAVAHGATANLDVFNDLKTLGQLAEQSMLTATNGSNAHKGAIWSLGLLVSAASMLESVLKPNKAFAIAATAGTLAKQQCLKGWCRVTHGMIVSRRYNVIGALGEAQAGFPHVISTALPVLRKSRNKGECEETAQLNALLALLSEVDDTCILYRGGAAALHNTKVAAKSALAAGGAGTRGGRQILLDLDRSLIETNCSPGGCADLLAATIFLDALERGLVDIEPFNSHAVPNKEM